MQEGPHREALPDEERPASRSQDHDDQPQWQLVDQGPAERPFRTMMGTPSRLEDSPWTGHQDARVTRFGNILRKTHLDELPQVINLFKGDLSIVGPRPEQPGYVDRLSKAFPSISCVTW
jgi:hypothetical protein